MLLSITFKMYLLLVWIILFINVKAHPATTHAPQDTWEPPLLVTALPDGVSISGAEDLLQIVASWDIFITLEPPPYPADLAERVAELDSTFESVAKLSALGVHMNLQPFKILLMQMICKCHI